jgi:mRNA interferase RelE/StbE
MIVIANEKFWKSVKRLKNPQVAQKILDTIEDVEEAQTWQDIKELKRLKGAIAYRIRIGDYRIGVLIENDTVEFISVGHRKEFYQSFP